MTRGEPKHWTEPGAWPVAPGVHRIPLPLPMDGLRAVNVYAIETDEGLTLVDGGWAIEESRTLLERSLASIERKVGDITRFLVTHVHRDHYTQAVTVRREFGSHVSLGIGDRPTLDAVSTPGHTQGHFVFADQAAGLLFAGDHVLPTITPSIGFEPVLADQPLGDFLSSLAKVRALPDLTLLPAHGPVTGSTHHRIDELVVHHDRRLDLCREALSGDEGTAYDVACRLPWTRHERNIRELDLFNAALATLETRAHLELLVARGELTRTASDDGFLYTLR